jgi:formylglycine-generating enzyme required for sulfatase activity
LPHKHQLVGELWPVVESPEKGKEGQRLRAAAALATYNPESEKWAQSSALVVHDLVQQNPIYLLYWSEAFRPVKEAFLAPLRELYRDQRPEGAAERYLATYLLADYAADNSQVLADLLMDADERQFAVIYLKLREQGEKVSLLLIGEIDKKLPADLPAADTKRETLAKRQVNAAVALLRMNQPAKVWPLLKHSSDPRVRSYLIHRLSPLGADAGAIVKQLDMESDVTIRQALVLSLGEYGETEFTPDARNALLPRFQTLYRTANDPGLHAACEWLLRRWKQETWLTKVNEAWAKDKEQREKRLEGIGKALAKDKEKTPPQWYVNTQGQTMVVIHGPVEFVMGSPLTEKGRRRNDEFQHTKRIGRTFALAAAPVTKEQFLRFQPSFSHSEFMRYPLPTCPIGGVTWYEAAAYCNWLSQQEGIPDAQWCYETDAKGQVVKLKPNYLSLTGYRLPTETEWEYACRAGAATSRYYGETAELQTHYGWNYDSTPEQTQPVGTKKPNDWGLFDMLGNVVNWCQERHKPYPAKSGRPIDDVEDIPGVISTDKRVLRGGSFLYAAGTVRSADRIGPQPPSYWSYTVGFRPARTFTP